MKRFACYVLTTGLVMLGLYQRQVATQTDTVKELAPGVFFHEGDIKGKGHCNNGWIVFEDYVLVIDANFPSGAQEIIPKIKAQTNKPIRFAFDTHHHGDHAYGNQVWVDNGGSARRARNVLAEMRKYETGLFGGKPGRWEETAKEREDVKAEQLKPPSLLYRDEMIFDDGTHRVELLYFGVGHTHGDGFAWLPKEKHPLHGRRLRERPVQLHRRRRQRCVDRDAGRRQKLAPSIVAPGHGPVGDGGVLEAQRQFFVALEGGSREAKGPGARPRAGRRAGDSDRTHRTPSDVHRGRRQAGRIVRVAGRAGLQGNHRQGFSQEGRARGCAAGARSSSRSGPGE